MTGNGSITKLAHLIFIRRLTLVQNDPGAAFFAVSFIRHANYLYITHLRIGQVELFDLTGIQVLAAADDHILQTTGYLKISIGRTTADITGVQPTIGIDGLCGCLGHLVITLHNIKATGYKLTAFAVGQFFTGLRIDDLTFHVGEGTTYRFYAVIQILIHLAHGTPGRGFGLAVYGNDLAHVHLNRSTAHQISRTVGTRHDTGSHVGEVGFSKVCMIKQSNKHGGHTIKAGDVLIIDTCQRRLRREVRHGQQSTAMGHGRRHGKHHTKAVEHGHLDHHTIRGGQVHTVTNGLTIVYNIAMGQHNTLGEAGGTGGVLHVTYIIGFNQGSAATHFLMGHQGSTLQHLLPIQTAGHIKAYGYYVAQEGQILRIQRLTRRQSLQFRTQFFNDLTIVNILTIFDHDQSMGIGLFQQILDLVDLICCVNGNQNRTDLSSSPEGNKPSRDVGRPHCHMIAGFYAQRDQSRRTLIHIASEFSIRTGIIQSRIFKGILVRIFFHHGIQYIREGSIDYIVLLPHEGTGLITVIVSLVIFFFIAAKRRNIISKVGQHDIRVIYLIVPCAADIAVIVQRSQCVDHLVHRQVALANKHRMIIFHITQSHIFDVSAQLLNGGFCTFTRTKEGAANVPGCAQNSRRKEVNNIRYIFRFSQIAHGLQQDLNVSFFRLGNGSRHLLLQGFIGNLFLDAQDHALNTGSSSQFHIANQHIGGHFFALHRLRNGQGRHGKTTVQKLTVRVGRTVISQYTVRMLSSFF